MLEAVFEFPLVMIALVSVGGELQDAAPLKLPDHEIARIGILILIQHTSARMPLAYILALAGRQGRLSKEQATPRHQQQAAN